ncbi:MAG: DUF1292 domain-containing protein [Lactobacillaceae bacterium]|jgi:uncharacterized protein YrzB (UPF0473 family)|nr:DUF1292 domain-containing protein [Lactobacillaceae bacterium]
MDDQDLITLVDDKGQEELYEVLFTFTESETYHKSYILVYAAGADWEEDDVDILAFSYDPNDTDNDVEGSLEQIEAEDEWAMIESRLDQFLDDQEKL